MAPPRPDPNAGDGEPHEEEQPAERPRANRPARPGPSLKARALALLARREHSRAELVRKLSAHADNGAAIEQALDELTARGFLNDARVVDTFIHSRASRFGIGRLRQDLDRKGIASPLSAPALDELRDSEGERAWALWQQKFSHRTSAGPATNPNTNPNLEVESDAAQRREAAAARRAAELREFARQQRFLLSRGFSAAVVNATLRRARQHPPDNRERTEVADNVDGDWKPDQDSFID